MAQQQEHVVIIGAGHAGGSLATLLRQYEYPGTVTLIGKEAMPPYQRPPLSKAWLKDAVTSEDLWLKPAESYEASGIALRLGSTVARIDKTARRLVLDSGDTLPYDHLVIATGAGPRRLALPGCDLAGVSYLRDLDDAATLKANLRAARRVAILGGGYIGLEVAATARHFGADVVVLEREPRLLSRSASVPMADYLKALHEGRGVTFQFNTTVSEIEGKDGAVCAVRLGDGTRLDCDMVLVGIGALPNTVLAADLGIAADGGIEVDAEGHTGVDGIFAMGDVTRRPVPFHDSLMRLESVPSALEQARRIACVIAGRALPALEVPWFWSDQYEQKLQIAGITAAADQTVLRGNPADGKFCVFHLRGGILRAAECSNSPGEFMGARKAILAEARPEITTLADARVPMATALVRPHSQQPAPATH